MRPHRPSALLLSLLLLGPVQAAPPPTPHEADTSSAESPLEPTAEDTPGRRYLWRAGGGCVAGAIAGTVVPGLGNAVGCVVGALGGWLVTWLQTPDDPLDMD